MHPVLITIITQQSQLSTSILLPLISRLKTFSSIHGRVIINLHVLKLWHAYCYKWQRIATSLDNLMSELFLKKWPHSLKKFTTLTYMNKY